MKNIDYKEAIAEIDKAIQYLYDVRKQLNKEWKKSISVEPFICMDRLEADVRSIWFESLYESDLLEDIKEQEKEQE